MHDGVLLLRQQPLFYVYVQRTDALTRLTAKIQTVRNWQLLLLAGHTSGHLHTLVNRAQIYYTLDVLTKHTSLELACTTESPAVFSSFTMMQILQLG